MTCTIASSPLAAASIAWTALLLANASAAQALPVPPAPPDEARVNAPVAPEAIYVGRSGAAAVIDLNGFGQGTGELRSSRFVLNPNVGQPGLYPALTLGTSSLDAGGAGVLTLTRDTQGRTELLAESVVGVDDLHVGQPLDLLYNNEHRNWFSRGNQVNPATGTLMRGNTISVAPHPNPPRLLAVPPAPEVGIHGEEPTTTTSGPIPDRITTNAPPARPSPLNLLTVGNPFAQNRAEVGIFGARYSGIFVGPQPPPVHQPARPYAPYTSRQQVGHFLYVLDRARGNVLAVNSNRFTVLQRFTLNDPYSAALSPNLRWLAVSNYTAGTVSFLDVDPRSPTFHRVLADIPVGRGPTGLAWQPEGEDLLVCNTLDDTVTILSAATFQVRKVLRNGIRGPQEVAVSARQVGIGLGTYTWFAVVLNGDGTLASYESGPVPYGTDDSAPLALGLRGPTVVKARSSGIVPEFYVAHRDALGLGQVSLVSVGLNGTRRTWTVTQRYGGIDSTTPRRELFSGNAIVDLAFDEVHNDGAAADLPSLLPGLTYAEHSGKGHLKRSGSGIVPAHRSLMLFAACGDTGRVDVMELTTGVRLATIAADGVRCLAHYWRQ